LSSWNIYVLSSQNATNDTANYVINRVLPKSWSNSVVEILLQLSLNSLHQNRSGEDERIGRASTRQISKCSVISRVSLMLSQGYNSPLEGEGRLT
jgi:hypothetical protein